MEQIFTVDETAAQLKCHRNTVLHWIEAGILPASKINRQWRITESDIRSLLHSGRVGKEP